MRQRVNADEIFKYHPPASEEVAAAHEKVRRVIGDAYREVQELLPMSREASLSHGDARVDDVGQCRARDSLRRRRRHRREAVMSDDYDCPMCHVRIELSSAQKMLLEIHGGAVFCEVCQSDPHAAEVAAGIPSGDFSVDEI